MERYRLRLDEYTISAKDSCLLTTLQEAELAFLQEGIWGKVMLVQAFKFVTDVTHCNNHNYAVGIVKYLWFCYSNDGESAFLPLFYEDSDWNKIEYDAFQPVVSTTYIYRNQQLCVISVDNKKRINVR